MCTELREPTQEQCLSEGEWFHLGWGTLCEYGIFRIFEHGTVCLRTRIIQCEFPVGRTFARVLAVVTEDPLGAIVMKDMTAESGLEMAAAASWLAV